MTTSSPSLRPFVGRVLPLAFAVLAAGCAASSSSGGHQGGAGNTTGATGTAGSSAGSAGFNGGTAGSSSQGTAGAGTGQGGGSGTGTAGAVGGTAGGFGTAGMGSGGIGGGAGAGGGGVADAGACLITLTTLSGSDLEAGGSLQLQASVSGYAGDPDGGGVQWSWTVEMDNPSHPDASPEPSYKSLGDGSTIEISLATAGTYQVNAHVEGAPMCDRLPVAFVVKQPQTPSLLFRVTPPAGAQLPMLEVPVKTNALANTPGIDLGDARASELVSLSPVDARGFAIPSYIRVSPPPPFSFDIEGYTGRGALIAALSTNLPYDALIIPDGGLAPLLVSGFPDALANQMAITPGASVTGVMRDGAGNPVSGAHVILTFGARPSTVGLSAADGTFALTTRDGSLSADILPPAGSGLPEALVGSPGIFLTADMKSLALSMDWAKVPAGALTIKASAPGAGTPVVAGSRVHADLATPLANVGTLTVTGPTANKLTATGTAHADAVTDDQGVASLGLLPAGLYHVIVAPPDGAAGVGITLADVALPAVGATTPVPLAAPVTFSGTLTPASGAAGAKVTAIDRGLLAAATLPTATVAADGTYQIALAAGRTYELLVEPDPAKGLARSIVGSVTPGASGGAGSFAVPPAVLWSGNITGAGRSIAGAFVQVFCVTPPAASCPDPSFALAQGTTAADGTIRLALPGQPVAP
jgi:hypothetical protein